MAACAAVMVLRPCAAALYWLFYNEFRVGPPRAVDTQRKSNVARMDLTGAARRKCSSAIRWQVERFVVRTGPWVTRSNRTAHASATAAMQGCALCTTSPGRTTRKNYADRPRLRQRASLALGVFISLHYLGGRHVSVGSRCMCCRGMRHPFNRRAYGRRG